MTLSASTALEYAFEEEDPATGHQRAGAVRARLAVHELPRRRPAQRRGRRRRGRRDLGRRALRLRLRPGARALAAPDARDGRGRARRDRDRAAAGADRACRRSSSRPPRAASPACARAPSASSPRCERRAAALVAVAREALERLRATTAGACRRPPRPPGPRAADGARRRRRRGSRPHAAGAEPPPPPPPAPAAVRRSSPSRRAVAIGGRRRRTRRRRRRPTRADARPAYDFDGDGRQEIVLGAARGIEATVTSRSASCSGTRARVAGGGAPLEDAGVPGPPARERPLRRRAGERRLRPRRRRADLAIGVPGRDRVAVLYAPSPDERPAHARLITARRAAPARPRPRDFGFALLAADFDGDGFDDLAVGAPGTPRAARGLRARLGARRSPAARGGLDVARRAGRRGRRTDARRLRQLASRPATSTATATSISSSASRDEPDIDIHGHLAFCPGAADGPDGVHGCRPRRRDTRDLRRWPSPTSTTTATRTSCRATRAPTTATRTSRTGRGEVRLWLGGEGGLGERAARRSRQGTPGIPGDPEPGDDFGHDGRGRRRRRRRRGRHHRRRAAATRAPRHRHGHPRRALGLRAGRRPTRSRPDDRATGNLGGALGAAGPRRRRPTTTSWSPARTRRAVDEALVAYMREGNHFGPGVALIGLDGLAEVERLAAADRPLTARFGREPR